MQSRRNAPVTTLGTLRTESEMERKPEVPASTQDEAFSIAAKPEESREARPKSTVCLTSQSFLLGRKVMTNLDSILKSREITLPTKVRLVKAMVFVRVGL